MYKVWCVTKYSLAFGQSCLNHFLLYRRWFIETIRCSQRSVGTSERWVWRHIGFSNRDYLLTILILHDDITDIKRDNEKIHKSLSLQMQVCRQEIVEHVRHLKNSVTRMVSMSTNGTHSKDDKENDLSNHHDLMDDDSSNDDDDDDFHRWWNAANKRGDSWSCSISSNAFLNKPRTIVISFFSG